LSLDDSRSSVARPANDEKRTTDDQRPKKDLGLNMETATTAHKRVDIRRNDTVKVITGRDKGKEGRVLRVFPNDAKILVEHVMVVKKHVRPNPQRNIKGGIAEQESRISISNVQLVCGTCGPVRIGHELRGDRKVRVCKKCGTTLEK
jgi:large subunit ribosomal protein L24